MTGTSGAWGGKSFDNYYYVFNGGPGNIRCGESIGSADFGDTGPPNYTAYIDFFAFTIKKRSGFCVDYANEHYANVRNQMQLLDVTSSVLCYNGTWDYNAEGTASTGRLSRLYFYGSTACNSDIHCYAEQTYSKVYNNLAFHNAVTYTANVPYGSAC